MAPEQLLGGAVDHRCDIFALGVVIYEMAVGASPFAGDDITQIMYQIVNAAPPAPSAVHPRLPAMLDLVLARALAKNPDSRYQDARELAADLRACAAQLAAAAPPRAAEDDSTQTLPIGSFALPDADTEETINLAAAARRDPPRDRHDAGPRLPISRRFDSTEAIRRLALAGAGDEIEQTVRLDRAALAAASVPPTPAPKRAAEPAAAPEPPRRSWLLWAGVTIAALVAAAIALG
jgi:serine/threonine-protein kinase